MNHAKQATKYIDEGYVEVATDEELDVSIRLAHVHAALHLAEKQHMGNLIAAHAAFGSNIGSWPADIREGLGL